MNAPQKKRKTSQDLKIGEAPKIGLAIFVKTPNLSPLKTRLAASIGKEKAIEFFKLSVKAIEETMLGIEKTMEGRFCAHWAVAEREGGIDPLWQKLPRFHTGDGNLGARQEQVFNRLLTDFDHAILLGADTPQISKTHVVEAIKALDCNDHAFGPAHDGGYYLLAGQKSIASQIWSSVPWSSPKTRETFCQKLPQKPALLSPLSDVDVAADLLVILDEMPAAPNQAQLELMSWIKGTV